MIHRIQFEQWVPATLEMAFLFFADPRNLPRIMPPNAGTEITELKLVPPTGGELYDSTRHTLAGEGSEIITSFRMLPFLPLRATWIAAITEFEWNHHFADKQVKGPFKYFHHRHEFAADSRNGAPGTLIKDVIDYDAGFGAFGRLAGGLFIEPRLRRTFAYRQNAVTRLLTAAPTSK
jgi:ligand-binding SRPBCC domain-containing protein